MQSILHHLRTARVCLEAVSESECSVRDRALFLASEVDDMLRELLYLSTNAATSLNEEIERKVSRHEL